MEKWLTKASNQILEHSLAISDQLVTEHAIHPMYADERAEEEAWAMLAKQFDFSHPEDSGELPEEERDPKPEDYV